MHPIDSRFRGSNALMSGDVNGDGLTDYVTNYEFDQRYVVELHPPRGADPRRPWPTVVAFFEGGEQDGVDTESAALADLDGDGNLDIVGSQGTHPTSFFEGNQPGVRVLWGPPPEDAMSPSAWIDARRFPATIDQGHFLWAVPFDVNGDGALDVLVGGRVQWNNGARASIKWIEAPRESSARRDLAAWRVHDIDPDQLDGHGFVLADLDEDGDLDVLDQNADFDTPPEAETLHWYENPGTGSEAQRQPWSKHVIYTGDEFYLKPQIALVDLDRDGHEDFVTAVDDAIYWFRKTSTWPVAFERVVIPKDPVAIGRSRPVRVGDVNGDGKPDIVVLQTHTDGVIPADRAAAFWMEYEGEAPRTDNWRTHVIKWGSGEPMQLFTFGEKWDQAQLVDVDGDADLDLVANCEEWWADEYEVIAYWRPEVRPQSVGVVWFENRLHEPPHGGRERDGRCVIEGEHYADALDSTWVIFATYPDFAGDGYVQDFNSVDATPRAWNATAGLAYDVDLDGGEYSVWVRRWVPGRWGRHLQGLGGGGSNSAWVGFDGAEPDLPIDDEEGSHDAWEWVRAPAPVSLARGAHRLELRAREGGYAVDRIVLTTDSGFVPQGEGPAETGAR
ncbi:MAG TPA: VCBS repeat-containing protein [Candidatus Binatia bacterium]|nr:VCBS repeat-containing protein [Candidatus Binatia bacterium]